MLRQFRDCLYLLDTKARLQFSLLALMMVVSASLESLSVGLILPFLQMIEDPSSLSQIPVFGDIRESLAAVSNERLFLYSALGLLGVVVVKNGFLVVLIYCQFRVTYRNQWLLSTRLYRIYLENPFIHAMQRNSADLIRNVYDAVNEATGSVILGFVNLLTELFVIVAITSLLLSFRPMAALSAALVLGAAVTLYHVAARQKFVSWGERSLNLRSDVLKSLQQGLHSLKTTQVHQREDYFLGRFSQAKRAVCDLSAFLNTANTTPRLWVETVIVASVLVMVAILIAGDTGETGILPVLGLFTAAAFRLMPSINRLIISFNNIKQGQAALQSVVQDFRQHRGRLPATDAGVGPMEATPIKSIRLENVTFAYPEMPTPAIDGISMDISPGESLGLVGPSGAGKTTLVDILLGLLAPTSGRILINGQDLSRIIPAWRRRLGYVPQSIYILDDTLRRNIAFGHADGEIDEAAILKAIKLAQLEEFVEGVENGLDTVLGEHGARLSGGQQQRIGIARALYHDPDILVFDEATSSLDTETEREINLAIDSLRGIKTLIIIAHRLSTVRQCDRLIYLENGKLADSGPFEELASSNDAFRNLVELSRL